MKKIKEKIKVISFDVDGTLVPPDFVNGVWLEGIPSLYAHKNKISFEKAYEIVIKAYDEVGENRIEWYYLEYWLKRFNLGITREELFNKYKNRIKIYEEVEHVLKKLNSSYKLIICSNAERDFIFFQLKSIIPYFSHIFSATSDFKQVKKSEEFYGKVCELLQVKPDEIIHVGDHPIFDYVNPRKIGINAFLLNRKQNEREINNNCNNNYINVSENHVIKDLREILKILD